MSARQFFEERGLSALTLFHRLSNTLYRDATAVVSLIAGRYPTVEVGDGKRSAGEIGDANTPALL